jgi:UDP-N-acetyl-2-amino-2-deoxyglucuronate dehydrogenase
MTERANFALTGAAGYIAPRHLQAVKDTGGRLVAALDPHDAVGVLDRYFPDCRYFREFERFDRHVEMLRRKGEADRVHYVSICSPNYLHDAHVRFALRVGAHAICEKPLVLSPWNLDALEEMQAETGGLVSTILQLRLHDSVLGVKSRLEQYEDGVGGGVPHEVTLTYVTARGPWYDESWKGNQSKSGGVVTNIGVHFLDVLLWMFGPCAESLVFLSEPRRASGWLRLRRANVRWFLSVNADDLPREAVTSGLRSYRQLRIRCGEEVDLSGGFERLHTLSYERILEGEGFGILAARPSVELAHRIRTSSLSVPDRELFHPFMKP